MIGLLANRPPSAKTCWGPPGILGSLTRASGRSAPHWSPCRHRPTDSCRLAARRQSSEAVSRRRFWAGCRPSVDGWCGTGASRSESASSSAPRLKANDPLQGGWGAFATRRVSTSISMWPSAVGDAALRSRHTPWEYRERSRLYGRLSAGFILLDADRLEEDRPRGRDPRKAVEPGSPHLVYLKPNLEGLLLRLHPDRAARFATAHDAARLLQTFWPEYVKPIPADALGRRFRLDDLRRAAQCDPGLRGILEMLGL